MCDNLEGIGDVSLGLSPRISDLNETLLMKCFCGVNSKYFSLTSEIILGISAFSWRTRRWLQISTDICESFLLPPIPLQKIAGSQSSQKTNQIVASLEGHHLQRVEHSLEFLDFAQVFHGSTFPTCLPVQQTLSIDSRECERLEWTPQDHLNELAQMVPFVKHTHISHAWSTTC